MAKMKVFTYENLVQYDNLLKNYISTEDAKSLKTVTIVGNTVNFYREEEPLKEGEEAPTPAYSIELPETDISGLIEKMENAKAGNVVIANADGTVADGGIALADLATDTELKTVSDKADKNAEDIEALQTSKANASDVYTKTEVNKAIEASEYDDTTVKAGIQANADAIAAINNADTGILKTAQTYADTKVQELAEGAVKTNTDAIAKLNGDAETEGSVAKTVADAVAVIDAKVGDITTLDTTAKTDVVAAINEVKAAVTAGGEAGVVTIDSTVTTEGALKSYTISQGGTKVGVIDIPKDLVVTEGSVVVDPEGQAAGTYIKLVIANQDEPLYINVGTLVDLYTAKANATQIQLTVDNTTREISAVIVAGSVGTTELADGAVTTVKIADANVTLAKLATDVTDAIADAKKAGTDASAAVTALADGQVATNKTNIEALQGLVGEGYEAISTDEINALFA